MVFNNPIYTAGPGSLRRWVNGYRSTREQRWADEEIATGMRWAFREACVGAGVALQVDAAIAGTQWRAPEVTDIELGPPTRLTVRMLPGQVPAQLQKAGQFIAPHIGGVALRVQDRKHGWAIVTVLDVDPLAEVFRLDLSVWRPRLLLGRDEGGTELEVDPHELPHIITQGQTRSGKSTWLYGLLAQLAYRGDVLIGGVDPSGITLRPFADTHHADWQTLGLASLDVIEKTLADLVAEMDRRLAAMPLGHDVLPISPGAPLIVVLLEEWPGTLKALDLADAKQGKRVRGLVARLLAESHKVGFRVVLAGQRAEAAIFGAAERAQCGGRLSFRVDSADSVKLLHADGDADDYAPTHTSAPPGIALLTWPGRPLGRIRAPFIDYADYCGVVTSARLPGHEH